MRAAILILMLLSVANTALAERLRGAARVLDGDTLVIGATTVRLLHIDAPETGQPHGAEATIALTGLTRGRTVICKGGTRDTYGRLLAECTVDGTDLNRALVAQGHAAVFRRYGDTYDRDEREARTARRGLWREADPVMPWSYRAARWRTSADAAPDPDCPIKGNISAKGDRIYHAPWSRWYDRTRITQAAGERWFCTEAEALAAGWRAPRG